PGGRPGPRFAAARPPRRRAPQDAHAGGVGHQHRPAGEPAAASMRSVLFLLLISAAAAAQPVPDPVREKPAEAAPEPITPPKLVEPVLADYPAGEIGAARVILQLDVDVQGRPQNVKVISSPQPGFDESALAAAPKLHFEPAL